MKETGICLHRPFIVALVICASVLVLCAGSFTLLRRADPPCPGPSEEIDEEDLAACDLILQGARAEVKNRTRYDDSYVAIPYPGGDVAPGVGACTDVVIRALRNAGIDLQKRIHEDMSSNFDQYPGNWGLSEADSNIDHRRIPNQIRYFERFGQSLLLEVDAGEEQWQRGDLVYWRFPDGRQHCGVVSDRVNSDGVPLVIHNAGITREEDCLQRWEIIGHFRYPVEHD